MAPIIAIGCQKGGVGSTFLSGKLACGLGWEADAVDLVQVTTGGMLPSFSKHSDLPFVYVPLMLDGQSVATVSRRQSTERSGRSGPS